MGLAHIFKTPGLSIANSVKKVFHSEEIQNELNATIGEVAAPRQSATFYADEHGMQGDWTGTATSGSGTNDTAAFQELLDSVPDDSLIVMGQNKRYRLDPVSHSVQNLRIDWNRSSVITRTQTAPGVAAPFFATRGSVGEEIPMGIALRGATRIYPSDVGVLSQFAVGDYILVADKKQWTRWDTGVLASTTGRAEVNYVVSKGGSSIELAYPLSADYNANQYMRKINPVYGFHSFNGPYIEDTDPGAAYTGDMEVGGPHLFFTQYAIEPIVEGVVANGVQGHAVNFARCFLPRTQFQARNPFRPESGGHGYGMRFFQSADGLAHDCVGFGMRHLVNTVGTQRSGSENCTAYATNNVAFQSHGLGAVDTFSRRDKVVGGLRPGWAIGNPSFNADAGYEISQATYRGVREAFASRSRSTGLRVLDPDVVTSSSRAIVIAQGSDDVLIDIGRGRIEIVGSPDDAMIVQARARYDDADADVAKPGSVTIIGDRLRGSRRFDIDITGALQMTGVPMEDVRIAAVGSDSRVIQQGDASDFGVVRTFLPGVYGGTSAWPSANQGFWIRALSGGRISKIGLNVAVQSGNICLAVYRGEGIGRLRKPAGAPVITTGSIACPATGYQEVDLGGAVDVRPGDYLFMSCDNSTAAFTGQNGQTSELYRGTTFAKGASFPAPADPGAVGGTATRAPQLLGIA